MKEERDYIKDIAEIRSMMERSSKFMSLTGWAGIMAGIYALAGAFIAWKLFDFHPVGYSVMEHPAEGYGKLFILGVSVLFLAVVTAIYDAGRKARSRGEKAWNVLSRQLLFSMAIPLLTGGILMVILLTRGMLWMLAPLSLIFYGLALFNAGRFTYREVRILGFFEILLGFVSVYFVEYGLLFWAAGFGVAHIIYGIIMQIRYRK